MSELMSELISELIVELVLGLTHTHTHSRAHTASHARTACTTRHGTHDTDTERKRNRFPDWTPTPNLRYTSPALKFSFAHEVSTSERKGAWEASVDATKTFMFLVALGTPGLRNT